MKKILSKQDRVVVKVLLGVIAAALVCVMLTSCGSDDEDDAGIGVAVKPGDGMQSTTITFEVGPGAGGARTRATLTELTLTDLWVMDYNGDGLAQTIHQTSTDDDFGTVSLDLTYGEHTVCFCASKGTDPTVDGDVITWSRPNDTFWKTVTIDVQPGAAPVAPVTLQRVVTRLMVAVTDKVPDNAAKLTITPDTWYYGLNVATGEACGAQKQERSVNIPASYIGTEGRLSVSLFSLSLSTEWQTDISVDLQDADGTSLGRVTLADVVFNRNVTTSYSGGILGKGGEMQVTADDAWGADDEHTW